MHRRLAGQTYFDGDLLYFAEAAGAVVEPPAKTDPAPAKTDGVAAPATPGGTAGASEGAPPDKTDTTEGAAAAGEPPVTPPEPTPTEAAISAQRKADALRMATRLGLEGEYSSVEEVEAALETVEEEAHQAELDAEVSNQYTSTLRTILENLRSHTATTLDAEGNEIASRLLTDDQIQKLVMAPINGLKESIRESERSDTFNVLADQVIRLLPDEAYAAFEKDASGGKAIGPWTEIAMEHLAPHTKWGKQQAAEREAYGTKRYDEGVIFGAKAPTGTVSQAGTGGQAPVTGDGKSVAEKALAIAEGSLDFKTEAARLGAHA